MRILMINSVCGIRSTGRICTDLAEALEKQGHEVKIGYGRESVPEKYRRFAVRISSETEVKLHGVKARLFDADGLGSKRATARFLRFVEEFNPDVIHLHNLHGYYINVPMLFRYIIENNKKVIWTLHDCWAFTGHCCNLNGCDKWKSLCNACPKHKLYPASITDRSHLNYQRKKELFTAVKDLTVITPSQWLADLAKQSFLGSSRIEVIPNGIDLDVFRPRQSDFKSRNGLDNKKIVLGVASAWSKSKGLYDFFKLAEMLPDDYKIVMVGLKDEQMGLVSENILAIKRTNNVQELAEIYTAADVFVNATYNDNYPTVNLEAQACGTPVITYRTGGSVESVPAENVVEQGDLQGLKNKILANDFACHPNLKMGKNDMLKEYVTHLVVKNCD